MKQLLSVALLLTSLVAGAQFTIVSPEGKPWAGQMPIKGVRVYQHIESIDTAGNRAFFDSSFTEIFSAGNIFLHDLTYHYSRVIQDIELVAEPRHHYFIYAKDSAYGYDWDGYRDPVIMRFRVDSVLNKKDNFGPTAIEQLFESADASLIKSSMNRGMTSATEVFSLQSKKDPGPLMQCTVNYRKQPQLVNVSLAQSPACQQGLSITSVRLTAECYPCKIDIRYALQPVSSIKPNISSIFEVYRTNETAKLMQFPAGSTTILGSWQ